MITRKRHLLARWLPIWLALAALPSAAHAASSAPSIASMVEYSAHLVVGKVLRTELITGSFGNQIRECGITASVQIVDDLTGRAPRIATVGFRHAPVTGSSYFMALWLSKGNFPSDVIIPPRPTEEYRTLMNCWSNIPALRVVDGTLAELIKVSTTESGRRVISEWAYKDRYPLIPAEIPNYQFPPPEEHRYDSVQARDRLRPAVFRLGAEFVSWPEYRELFVQEMARSKRPR
jgi:hypothetical protein